MRESAQFAFNGLPYLNFQVVYGFTSGSNLKTVDLKENTALLQIYEEDIRVFKNIFFDFELMPMIKKSVCLFIKRKQVYKIQII